MTQALSDHHVLLEGTLLKPNMVCASPPLNFRLTNDQSEIGRFSNVAAPSRWAAAPAALLVTSHGQLRLLRRAAQRHRHLSLLPAA